MAWSYACCSAFFFSLPGHTSATNRRRAWQAAPELPHSHLSVGFMCPCCSAASTSRSCSRSDSGSSLRQGLGAASPASPAPPRPQRLPSFQPPPPFACTPLATAPAPLAQRLALQLPLLLVPRNLLGSLRLPAGPGAAGGQSRAWRAPRYRRGGGVDRTGAHRPGSARGCRASSPWRQGVLCGVSQAGGLCRAAVEGNRLVANSRPASTTLSAQAGLGTLLREGARQREMAAVIAPELEVQALQHDDGLTFYGVSELAGTQCWLQGAGECAPSLALRRPPLPPFAAAHGGGRGGGRGRARGHVPCGHAQDAHAGAGAPWAAGACCW